MDREQAAAGEICHVIMQNMNGAAEVPKGERCKSWLLFLVNVAV